MNTQRMAILTLTVLVMLLIGGCGQTGESQPATSTPDLAATVAASLAATQTAQAPAAETETEPEAEADEPAVVAGDESDQTPTCLVSVPTLRLRSGPSTQFEVVGLLAQGDTLAVIGANPAGDWFLAESDVTDAPAWFNASPTFVECSGEVTEVAADLLPATPTLAPTDTPEPTVAPDVDTPTPTFTPSPTPVALVVVPRAGGGDGDMAGDVFTDPRISSGPRDNPIFSEYLSLQIEVWVDAPGAPEEDGAGVKEVRIAIVDPNGETVYEIREENPAFCLFGGDGPCNLLRMRPGDEWPGGNDPILNGPHTAQFQVIPLDSNKNEGTWNVNFQIRIPGNTTAGGNIVSEWLQIGQNSLDTTVADTLVFQVSAFDDGIGYSDGDGIDFVDMRIYDPYNNQVYQRTEGNAGFCAFGGGEPNCNVFDLKNNQNWPDGGPKIDPGKHTLRAIIQTDDGRQDDVQREINIVRTETPPPATSEIVVKLAQVGPGSTSPNVSGQLVFHVHAYDSAKGNSDGDGIDNLVMNIFDGNGQLVYSRTENNAGYCAFGGGEPNCNVFQFGSGDSWPDNGPTINSGPYTLQAIIHAESGQQATYTGVIQVTAP